MKKKRELKTISLGSEPDTPPVSVLVNFISEYRGIEADLITFQMLLSRFSQKKAGIDEIAVGGSFCRSRLEEGLTWDEELGPLVRPEVIAADFRLLAGHGGEVKSVHESPAVLSSCPPPDDEDSFAEMFHGFRQVLRTLRDNGAFGHVIHLQDPSSLELELLSNPKSLFFLKQPTPAALEGLLEHTSDLVIQADTVYLVDDLMDRYQVRNLILYNASNVLPDALQYVDMDHLKVAGYGAGDEEGYWKRVKESAIIYE